MFICDQSSTALARNMIELRLFVPHLRNKSLSAFSNRPCRSWKPAVYAWMDLLWQEMLLPLLRSSALARCSIKVCKYEGQPCQHRFTVGESICVFAWSCQWYLDWVHRPGKRRTLGVDGERQRKHVHQLGFSPAWLLSKSRLCNDLGLDKDAEMGWSPLQWSLPLRLRER